MRFFEILPARLVESFSRIDVSKLGISDLVKRADDELAGEAADAIDRFVGVQPGAADRGEWGGVMLSRQLEDAYSANPSPKGAEIRRQLEAAFRPIRDVLKARFGERITLYRGQGDVGANAPQRHTLSWTSDPRVAAWFVGVDPRLLNLKPITDEEIRNALETYGRTGKVALRGKTYVRTETPTDDPDADEFYYDIYDRDGELLTDGDGLAEQLRDDQKWYQDLIDKRNEKLNRIVRAEIPIDDIIWITDRAGQSEFILHNRPGSRGYIDTKGKIPKSS